MKTIKLKHLSLKIGLTVGAGVILLVIFFHFILDNLIRNQLVNHAEELLKIAYTKLRAITKKNTGFSKEKLKAEVEKQLSLTKKEIKKSSEKIKESVEKKFLKQIFNN